MPNISYFNPVFEDDNKNVTLIRAERNAIWDYDKAERRHKSTNVLTYRHRDFDEFPEYIDARLFLEPEIRGRREVQLDSITGSQPLYEKSKSQPNIVQRVESFASNESVLESRPQPAKRRSTKNTSRVDRDRKAKSLDDSYYDSPPPSDIYDIFSQF